MPVSLCNKVLPYRFVPELSPRLYGLSLHDNMTYNTEGLVNIGVSSVSTSDLIQQLEHIYCGTLSAQFQQLSVSPSICVCRQSICCCFIVNTLKHAWIVWHCMLIAICMWEVDTQAHTEQKIEAFPYFLQRAQDKWLCQAANCGPCWKARAAASNHQRLNTLQVWAHLKTQRRAWHWLCARWPGRIF